MVSKKAIFGLIILVIFIGGTYFVADRLINVNFEGDVINALGGLGCPADSCHELGTEIDNSCFVSGDLSSCRFVINHPERPRNISENQFAWTVTGDSVECSKETDGFGGEVGNPRLFCFDSARYSKDLFLRTDSQEGIFDIVRFTVVGGGTLDELQERLCEMQGICATP